MKTYCFRLLPTVVLLLAGFGWSFVAPAQQTGAIEGEVVDTTGRFRFEGALVRVEGTDRRATTDRSGAFRIGGLDAGTYTLVVDYVGAPTQRTQVEVTAAQTATPRITVEGDAVETVVVVGQAAGQAAALSRERNAINNVNVLSADAIGDFPDNNVAEALQRVPGISCCATRVRGASRSSAVPMPSSTPPPSMVCAFQGRKMTLAQ